MPIELITALQDIGIMEVTKLLNIIYDTGEIPHDLRNLSLLRYQRSLEELIVND